LASVRDSRAGVQDEGSQLVILAALRAWQARCDPDSVSGEGNRWLDLCAGPGGKSALLRGLLGQRGFLLANDAQPHRAKLVAQALRAYPQQGHEVICCDGLSPGWKQQEFSLVVADVPCSGLGALRRRPEARWRHQSSIIEELAPLQAGLLDTAVEALAPGGLLAYITCSPVLAETSVQVSRAVADHGLKIIDAPALLSEVSNVAASSDARFIQLWPHRHGTDAMFCALLVKP
jgi:16S rRNA (cytosine967-C5)-methyltransferase